MVSSCRFAESYGITGSNTVYRMHACGSPVLGVSAWLPACGVVTLVIRDNVCALLGLE